MTIFDCIWINSKDKNWHCGNLWPQNRWNFVTRQVPRTDLIETEVCKLEAQNMFVEETTHRKSNRRSRTLYWTQPRNDASIKIGTPRRPSPSKDLLTDSYSTWKINIKEEIQLTNRGRYAGRKRLGILTLRLEARLPTDRDRTSGPDVIRQLGERCSYLSNRSTWGTKIFGKEGPGAAILSWVGWIRLSSFSE